MISNGEIQMVPGDVQLGNELSLPLKLVTTGFELSLQRTRMNTIQSGVLIILPIHHPELAHFFFIPTPVIFLV